MANNYSGRQLIIDTAPAIIPLANMKIGNMVWADAVAVGDNLTMVDEAGRTFIYLAYQANYPYVIGRLGWVSGPLTISVLASGKLYIYLE